MIKVNKYSRYPSKRGVIDLERITRLEGDDYSVDPSAVIPTDDGYIGEAIDRLAAFENMYEDLIASQSKISDELEKLRYDGKEKSVRFKELMVKKLTNINTLILLKSYGMG